MEKVLILLWSLAISSETTQSDTNSTLDCDTDPSEDWRVDYIGKSTQFRIYNPCDSKQFVKIKMTDLTEYDSNNQKTSNKVTGFASTDWEWDNQNGANTQYDGYRVIKNTFKVFNLIDSANFFLTTYLFKEDAVINKNETSVSQNSLKWNVNVTNWPFLDDENYLQLCINIMTNKGMRSGNGDSSDDVENGRWRAGEFELNTFNTADCGNDSISVNVSDQQNGGGNQRNLCFRFGVCNDTEIFYDPIVSYVGSYGNGEGGLTTGLGEIGRVGVIVGSIFAVLGCIGVVVVCLWC
eukprot:UN00263